MKNFILALMILTVSIGFTQAADLPLDFESGTFEFTDFDGGAVTVIDNPQSSDINTSAKTAQMVKSAGQVWGGSWMALDNPIDFSTNKKFKMKVFSPRVGAKVLLKVENMDDGGIKFEKEVMTTVANAWEELTFDYSLIDATKSYQKIVLIFDNGTMGDGSSNFTFLFDDIALFNDGAVTIAPSLPIDFESETITYEFFDFSGGVATLIPNPQSSGINTTPTVAQIVRDGGEVWGGSKLVLADYLDFSVNNGISMKVFTSAPVGTKAVLKLEGDAAKEIPMETTVSGAWETIVWDCTGEPAATYNALTFLFDLGNVGDGSANSTFLFDDIEQLDLTGGLSQIDLPLNFESETVNYTLSDFGGAATVLGADPSDAGNMVAITTKTVDAATWAGTTIGTAVGFATVVPLKAGESKISVDVYSPTAGIQVRLKGEDHNNVTLTVETEATTTVANAWETLVFDMSNVAAGTNPFNAATSFDKFSIFFNFDVVGAGKVYYWDNVKFGVNTAVKDVEEEKILISSSNQQLRLNLSENLINGRIDVYDLTGRQLLSRVITSSYEQLEMNKSGIVLVRISDASNLTILSKKVVVN